MGLRSYIETGIGLDALLTYDLLISIFNPGTPLHDGAVIVQGNRIAAAACFLPLTVNPELSRTLGSRHRAAIGVTEDTDAVAVVVSEETGTISLVAGGRIRRELRRARPEGRRCSRPWTSRRRRRRRRRRAPRPRPPGTNSVRPLLLENLALKLVSLALAALLWFVIAGEKTSEMGLSVPVELQNFPKDLELTGDAVNAVEVRLRACPSIIQSLGPGDVSAHVDLHGRAGGRAHRAPDRRLHPHARSG